MINKNKKILILGFIISALLTAMGIGMYLYKLNKVISDTTLANMEEYYLNTIWLLYILSSMKAGMI